MACTPDDHRCATCGGPLVCYRADTGHRGERHPPGGWQHPPRTKTRRHTVCDRPRHHLPTCAA